MIVERAFISIGSNIDPARYVREACLLLGKAAKLRAVSMVYLSDAVGPPGQAAFYNCVAEIETDLPPRELKFDVLRPIEDRLGRIRTADRFAARTIDLDLILYDGLRMTSDGLVLPHPDIELRPFVALPLAELAPELVLPGAGRSIGEVAALLSGETLLPLRGFTERLRSEVLHERK